MVGAYPVERTTQNRHGKKYRHTYMRLPPPPDENSPPDTLILNRGQRVFSPYWGRSSRDSSNRIFIHAVVEAVYATKVSVLGTSFL